MSLHRSKSPNIPKSRHQDKLTSNINNKKLRDHFNKLVSEFRFLPKILTPLTVGKHITKTFFWATVYLAFSYLTITSSFEMYQQYRDNQTTTNMKAIINKNFTHLPNMTICFKLNPSELFSNPSSPSFNYTLAWSRFFSETISPECIFKANESQIYGDEIYLSLFKYLAMIHEAERAWEPGLTQISTFHSEESDDWTAVKKILVPNIERYNITLEQLKSVFDGKFCSLSPYQNDYNVSDSPPDQLLASSYDSIHERDCIAGSKISFIGMDTICFRLIGYQISLELIGTTTIFIMYLFNNGERQEWRREFTIDLGTESRSTPRRATTKNETYTYYYNLFPGYATVHVDIGVKVLNRKLSYVKDNVQCSSDTTREECENKCFRGWIRRNCHCSPITFNLTADISSFRPCTVDDYSICLKQYAENATYMCTDSCVPLCEQWHYEYNLESFDFSNGAQYVDITLRTLNYVIIEQVFIWSSFEKFIGALGGTLGIWLGLDFVILTEFIVSLITSLIKKILLRNGRSSEEDNQQESANIENSEKIIENGISSSNGIGSRIGGHQEEYKENDSEIAGGSIRQINESEKQSTSRMISETNALEEEHVQQRRKQLNIYRVDSAISDGKMKNIDARAGLLRSYKGDTKDNIDKVQDDFALQANSSSDRSWFVQNLLLLLLNGDATTSKQILILQLTEILFWGVIYIVGSVLTTLWFIELIKLYLADEAVYYPSIIVNRTTTLPPPSLCIHHNFYSAFERDDNISNILVGYFGQSDIDKASFIRISNGNTWPKPLITIGLFYFSILANSETGYYNVSFISEYETQLNYSAGNDTLLRNDIEKSVNNILLPKLLEWNITANELRQKLGAELARIAELKIFFTNRNGTIGLVQDSYPHTTAITDKFFCYSLLYGVNFTDPEDVLEFSISRVSYPDLLPLWPGIILFSDFLLEPESARFIGMRENAFIYNSSYFPFDFGVETRVLISADGLYTSRPTTKGVKHCSPTTTQSYCRAQCRINFIENLCNCSPTYWTTMIQPTSGLDQCTFDRYIECLNFDESDDLDCKNFCLPSCTARHFQREWNKPENTGSDVAIATFSVKDCMSLSVEEKPLFLFNEFLMTVLLET